MKRCPVCLVVILLIIGSSLCFGERMTITDGDFANGSFTQHSNPVGGTGEISALDTGGNPGRCRTITTYMPTSPYTSTCGRAGNDEFVWAPATQGAIAEVAMNMDTKITGSQQDVVIVAFQSGQYFAGSPGGAATGS